MAVGDPGFLAIDDENPALEPCRGPDVGHIGPDVGFADAEAGEGSPAEDVVQIALAQVRLPVG
ncbi:hypothetical protein D3C80_1774450 [compost metagenome]